MNCRRESVTRRKAFTLLLAASFITMLMASCAAPQHPSGGLSAEGPAQVIVWPPSPLKPRIQFVRSIAGPSDIEVRESWFKRAFGGLFGKEETTATMLRPYGIFADEDTIYVTDPGIPAVHIIEVSEKKYFQIRSFRKEPLISPIGIAADETAIYVSDSVLKKIFVYDRKGNPLREIGGSGLFVRPTGISLEKDRLYVVDTYENNVSVMNTGDGKLLFRFGKRGTGAGEFNYPTNVCAGRDGFLYIVDSMNFRIEIFDRGGAFVSTFGRQGDSPGDLSKPKGIALDSEGHIYVADAQFDNVQIFDRSGRPLLFFGGTGRRNGGMVLPAGLFIDGRDRIYVADSFNKRIQIFQYLKEQK